MAKNFAAPVRSSRVFPAGLSFRSKQLTEEVAAETGGGVEGGQSEDGNSQSEQVVDRRIGLLAREGSEHGSNTTGEDGGRRAQEELVAAAGGGLAPHHADRDQGDNAEGGLNDHGAVADDLGVLLVVDLLGGSTGADQRMEAGAGAAGDRDEQEREEGLTGRVLPAIESRSLNRGSTGEGAADDGNDGDDHHAVEQEGAQVVTRLEQNPDRKQRSDRDIDGDEEHPEGAAGMQADNLSEEDDGNNADDADDGRRTDLGILAVHEETEDGGNDDEQNRGHGRGTVGGVGGGGRINRRKGSGNDRREGGDNQNQNGQREDDEEALGLDAHGVLHDLADGTAVVTDGGEQGAEVVHGTEEDTTEDAPQENGDPAENGSLDRSVNGACASDGGEMVTHQDSRVGGDKVLAVIAGVGRGLAIGVYSPLLCQPAAVENVAESKHHDRDHEDK